MERIRVKASAKINLTLDVTGKRDDGYHNIESIFQSIGIYDILTVEKAESGIIITSNDERVPCDISNIAYNAAVMFFSEMHIDGGVRIDIEKHIPIQAGLGGGSSDGAGVLYALNKLYETGLTIAELGRTGKKVSADTAFFMYGGTAYVQGIGERISAIRSIPPVDIVIAKGRAGISTPEAYRKIDHIANPKHPRTYKLLKAIDDGHFIKKCGLCENIFELVTDTQDVFDIKNQMTALGAETAVMSGSGSAVFGIFSDKEKALVCEEKLSRYYYARHCQAVNSSIVEI